MKKIISVVFLLAFFSFACQNDEIMLRTTHACVKDCGQMVDSKHNITQRGKACALNQIGVDVKSNEDYYSLVPSDCPMCKFHRTLRAKIQQSAKEYEQRKKHRKGNLVPRSGHGAK